MKDVRNNNVVILIGEISSELTFNHEMFGEKFYTAEVTVKRLSENVDIIPIMISDRLIDVHKNSLGRAVEVAGQFRSYNRHDGEKNRLILSVFVKKIRFLNEITDYTKANQIFLNGYICKVPAYRETPFGRKIADLFLAVNRPYGKSDYIPCISWGRNARYAAGLDVGTNIRIWGRVQSREYTKKLSETQCEKRVAYEVSIERIEIVEERDEFEGTFLAISPLLLEGDMNENDQN